MNEYLAPPVLYGLLAGVGVLVIYLGMRDLRAAADTDGARRRRDFIKVSAGLAIVAASVLLMAL